MSLFFSLMNPWRSLRETLFSSLGTLLLELGTWNIQQYDYRFNYQLEMER